MIRFMSVLFNSDFFRVPKPEICQLDQLQKMDIQIRDDKGNSFRNPLRKGLIQQNPCFAFYQFDTGSGPPNWSSIAERSMSIGTPKLSALVPCQIPSFSTKMEEGYLGTTLNLSGNCIYKSFPVTSNLRLSAIFWMWNNLFMGLWILDLTKQKKEPPTFLSPWSTSDYLQPFLPRYPMQDLGNIHRREVHEALRRWGMGPPHLEFKWLSQFYRWNEKQNVSWDKTDVTTYI